jgi:hypothetical protein
MHVVVELGKDGVVREIAEIDFVENNSVGAKETLETNGKDGGGKQAEKKSI